MRAVICRELGPPSALVVDDVPSPTPGPGQVRIAVKAAGVNFPDTLIIQGRYQFRPDPPFTPGGEAAGVVVETGPGVTGLQVGDRVAAMVTWGAFAEELVAEAAAVTRIPDAMDFETAAGITITYGTTMHAYRQRANLREGQTVLVLGASGGVGLSAVELGRMMGATVIAAASSEEKLALTREYGATHTVNYAEQDLKATVKALTGGQGADVVYDPVGGDLAEPALRSTAWEGTYLVVGFASGKIPALRANLLLLKGCQAAGVFWGDFLKRDPAGHQANMAEVYRGVETGQLKPLISETRPLEEAAAALEAILARKVRGKVVLTT